MFLFLFPAPANRALMSASTYRMLAPSQLYITQYREDMEVKVSSSTHGDVRTWKRYRFNGLLWGEYTGYRWLPLTTGHQFKHLVLSLMLTWISCETFQFKCWWFETPWRSFDIILMSSNYSSWMVAWIDASVSILSGVVPFLAFTFT